MWQTDVQTSAQIVLHIASRGKKLFKASEFQKWKFPEVPKFQQVSLSKFTETLFTPQEATSSWEWNILSSLWSRLDLLCDIFCTGISHRCKFGGSQLPYQTSHENPTSKRHPFGPSTTTRNNWKHCAMQPLGCRAHTYRYFLGVLYGKSTKKCNIVEVWQSLSPKLYVMWKSWPDLRAPWPLDL